mmetsp:Transcript_19542/g.42488  ORF Transcript_19542/g.42488 Transcript_19542/m.42488 type:complete len:213 (+) Transcript_19542:1363-2001(+)
MVRVQASRIRFLGRFALVDRGSRSTGREQNLYAVAPGVAHPATGVFEETDDNLGQVTDFLGFVQKLHSVRRQHGGGTVASTTGRTIVTGKPQDVDQRVQVALRGKVQTRANAPPHGGDGEIGAVIHVDQVSHVRFVVGPGYLQIVPNFLQEGAADLDAHAAFLGKRRAVLLRDDGVRHVFCERIQFVQHRCQTEMGIVQDIKADIVENVGDS